MRILAIVNDPIVKQRLQDFESLIRQTQYSWFDPCRIIYVKNYAELCECVPTKDNFEEYEVIMYCLDYDSVQTPQITAYLKAFNHYLEVLLYVDVKEHNRTPEAFRAFLDLQAVNCVFTCESIEKLYQMIVMYLATTTYLDGDQVKAVFQLNID